MRAVIGIWCKHQKWESNWCPTNSEFKKCNCDTSVNIVTNFNDSLLYLPTPTLFVSQDNDPHQSFPDHGFLLKSIATSSVLAILKIVWLHDNFPVA